MPKSYQISIHPWVIVGTGAPKIESARDLGHINLPLANLAIIHAVVFELFCSNTQADGWKQHPLLSLINFIKLLPLSIERNGNNLESVTHDQVSLLSFSSRDFLCSIKKQGKDRPKWGAAWNTTPFQSDLWCVMFFNETSHSHQSPLLSSTQTGKRAKERDRECACAGRADLCVHERVKDGRAHHRHHGDQAKDTEETTLTEFYWASLLYKSSYHGLKMTVLLKYETQSNSD